MTRAASKTIAVLCVVGLSGCTFGTLSTSKCLEYYGQGAVDAASQVGSTGAIEEAYAFCADGRARITATTVPLRAHGFDTTEPKKHFEVPNGWCLEAKRPVSGDFNVMRSLETICAIGDASRAYLTGGALTSSGGTRHVIHSIYDREALEALNKRLEQNRR